MSTPSPIPPVSSTEESSGSKLRFVMVFAAVLLVGALAYFFTRDASKPVAGPGANGGSQSAAMGPEESGYVSNVAVDHLEVSRAENFLHQEVTTISGQINNAGERALASVELTIEFSDDLNQIAQRETRSLFGPPGPPIAAGDHREFEVSFEHISNSWNMRQPAVKVTGLQFSPK
jgi:hypothetical protein